MGLKTTEKGKGGAGVIEDEENERSEKGARDGARARWLGAGDSRVEHEKRTKM